MKTKWYERLLSTILVLTLFIQFIPAQVWASVAEVEENAVASSATTVKDVPVTVVGEEASLRTESEKHFRLSDGSFIAVSYGMPVHYQNASGNWKDIDNTLSLSTDQSVYTAINAQFATAFAANLSTGRVFASSYNDVSVSLSLLDESHAMTMVADSVVTLRPGATISYNRAVEASILSDEYVQATSSLDFTDAAEDNNKGWTADDLIPDTLSSSVLYKDVYPGVDLLYTAYGYDIKEQIIVNTKQSAYRYDFFLEVEGLIAVLLSDNSIALSDSDGNLIYSIPAPYMTDHVGATSDAVSYALTQVSGGYVLTVTADPDWINSDDRELPVAIDPTLQTETTTSNDDIICTYVKEGDPDKAHPRYQQLYFGYSSTSSKEQRVFMNFAKLPDIPADSIITDAHLGLYLYDYSRVTTNNLPTAIFEVTDDIPINGTPDKSDYRDWINGLTWNTQPDYDTNNAIDYVNIKYQMGGNHLFWNLTELVKDWYADPNNLNRTIAMAITEGKQSWSSSYAAIACFLAYGSAHPPIFAVSYRNNTGIENYYTYATLGSGEAGTAYIADASGQLKIAKSLVSYSSTVNPFTLSLVYNSDYFSYNPNNDYQPPAMMGLNMRLGYGWTLSAVQRVEVPDGLENYLKYTDGDGTAHYFWNKPDDGDPAYYDEDGLGLKIEIDGNAYIMSDKKGNSSTFTDTYLTNIADENGNQYFINYTNKQITTIQQKNKDGNTITVATFAYSGDYVSTITDATETVYTLGYSNNKLSFITQDGTQIAAYKYSSNRIISMTDSQSGYSIAFTYAGRPGKVSHYKEISRNETIGNRVDITYDGYRRTTYRDYGADRTRYTQDDVLTHYLFDYAGRTVNAYSTDNNHNIIGASNAAYTVANKDRNYKDNNRILKTASVGMVAEQMLRNSGFETADRWTCLHFSRTNSNPRTGSYSLSASLSNINTCATATTQSPVLQMNQTYTLSAYVNTANLSFSGQHGVWICASLNGSVWESDHLRYSTSESVENGWTKISVTFTAPAAGIYTIGVAAQGVIGTLFVDDLQLECGVAPSNRNMLENGDFTILNYAWTFGSNGAYEMIDTRVDPYAIPTQSSIAKTRVATITSNAFDTAANISQTVKLNLPATKTYVLSGWAKGNSVPDDSVTKNQEVIKQFGLRAVVTYEDDSTQTFYAPFNADLTDWQYTSLTVVPDSKTHTVVKSITVYCTYEQNLNSVSFDNISLVQQAAQSMEYYEDGTLKESQTTGINENTSTYYENGNLKTTTNSAGSTTTYSYNDTNHLHRLTSYKTDQATTSFTYDSFGNVETTTIKDNDSTLHLLSETVYTGDGNLVSSSTDVNGRTSSYVYNEARNIMLGLPSRVSSANGTVTNILYDNFGRTTQLAVVNGATVVYTYSNGNISTIVRGSGAAAQTYRFLYDEFGNLTQILVGNKALATYVYAPNNGLLMTQTLGNQETTTFTYDYLGRINTETLADGRVVTYTYNGEGQLHSVTESGGDSPAAYYYIYDSNGRLISSEKRSVAGESLMRVHIYYNEAGQIAGQIWNIGGVEYIEGYTYNPVDGTLTSMAVAGLTLGIDYDDLSRLTSVNAGLYNKTYTYRNGTNGQTTTDVTKLSYQFTSDQKDFLYSHYLSGYLATYKEPGRNQITYYYDAQGQLTRAVGDTTYVYTYDTVGNILTANGHTYTYGSSVWRDLLTAYDGQSITYDNSGNPLSYYNGTRWTFTWENGRSLATATDGTTSISYAYDASGLRTSKTVDGVTHTYYYASGKLLRETYGSNVLDFFYDQNGQPFAFKHNGVLYYYIINLQGDVIYILDGSGATVATYEYDPYGNIVSATGTMAEINPLRYRGYVYDTDTGFYYLQSRYYDPAIGRFINADSLVSTGQGLLGNNMFAYCLNNPANYFDKDGDQSDSIWGWIGEQMGKWINEIINTDSNETDGNGNLTTNAKIKQTCEAFVDCIDASISVGMGYYCGIDWGYGTDFSLGMYVTNISVCFDDGRFFACQDAYTGASLSLGPLELCSLEESDSRLYTEVGKTTEWAPNDRLSQSVGIGFAGYAMIGGSVYIGLSINDFCEAIDRIWWRGC